MSALYMAKLCLYSYNGKAVSNSCQISIGYNQINSQYKQLKPIPKTTQGSDISCSSQFSVSLTMYNKRSN